MATETAEQIHQRLLRLAHEVYECGSTTCAEDHDRWESKNRALRLALDSVLTLGPPRSLTMQDLIEGKMYLYVAGRRERRCKLYEKLDKKRHHGTRVRVLFDDNPQHQQLAPGSYAETVMVTSLRRDPHETY